MTTTWRLMKGKRETPCCGQQVRVKDVAVGRQYRTCPLCKRTSVFVLEPVASVPGVLRMRWLTDSEAAALDEQDREGLSELDVKDL